VKDGHGRRGNWYGVTTDIEERKRAEAERERYRQIEAELAHVNRVTTMGELTASLAHEIRQPIASTMLNANITLRCLDREEPNLEKAREATKRILRDGARADDIITRVRSLYKKSAPHRESVDMNEVIREVLVLMQSEATRHAITLQLELADELPQIRGDRVQLQQVFVNLVLNGVEAMKEQERRVLTVSSQRQNGALSFMVRDTGIGLPSGKGDEIFMPFFTTKPQGTGMGLSICRSIVESHGGQLYALPNDGGGATFHLVLPINVGDADVSARYTRPTDPAVARDTSG
jgi:signal transduction histidine kinase